MAEQMIFKRTEMKYMLTREQQRIVLDAMKEHMVPDEYGRSTILSLYLDTPDHLLIRRSLEHPIYKEKLRMRSYGVASEETKIFVELKKKYDSIVYKRRVGMTEAQAITYLQTGQVPKDSQIVHEINYCLQHYDHIQPAMMLSYEREAYYDKDDHEFRMTFDDNILWREDHLSLCDGVYGTPILDDNHVLMEVKTANAIPLWLVKVLSENHIYKTTFSKYGTAYRTMVQWKQSSQRGQNAQDTQKAIA